MMSLENRPDGAQDPRLPVNERAVAVEGQALELRKIQHRFSCQLLVASCQSENKGPVRADGITVPELRKLRKGKS